MEEGTNERASKQTFYEKLYTMFARGRGIIVLMNDAVYFVFGLGIQSQMMMDERRASVELL